GVALCPVGGERRDLGGEHGLGADAPAQVGQQPVVLGGRGAGDDVPVDVLAGEAHLDPGARHRGLGHRGGHLVVERPVQVGQRHVDQDAGDRVGGRGGGPGGGGGGGGPPPRLVWPDP